MGLESNWVMDWDVGLLVEGMGLALGVTWEVVLATQWECLSEGLWEAVWGEDLGGLWAALWESKSGSGWVSRSRSARA